MLNAIGSIVYLATAVLCVRARVAAGEKALGRGDRLVWLGATLFFCILALMRIFALEDAIRDVLRAALIRDDAYAERHGFQSVLAASLLLAMFAGSILTWRIMHNRKWDRTMRWAIFGIIVMTGLVTLRIISFHATDALLYGPLHLNWFIDMGATVLTGWAAYIRARVTPSHRRSAGRK